MDKTIQCPVAFGRGYVDESSSNSLVPIYGLPDKLLLKELRYVGAMPPVLVEIFPLIDLSSKINVM